MREQRALEARLERGGEEMVLTWLMMVKSELGVQ